MCEANAFILRAGEEERILDSVDEVEVDEDNVRLINIFGEQKILKARIKLYSNSENKILLEPLHVAGRQRDQLEGGSTDFLEPSGQVGTHETDSGP